MVWANIAADLLTPRGAGGDGGAEDVVPPKAKYVYYNKMYKTFAFNLRVNGKKEWGPQRDTQAAAIQDRDKVLALRSGGASSAEVRALQIFQSNRSRSTPSLQTGWGGGAGRGRVHKRLGGRPRSKTCGGSGIFTQ